MNDINHQATASLTNNRHPQPIPEDRIADLKGKSSRDILKALPRPNLSLAMLVSTIGTVALMALLTFVPFLWGRFAGTEVKKPVAATKPDKTDNPDSTKPEQKTTETKPGDKKPVTADNKKDQAQPAKDVLNKLKENDVKKDKPKDPFGTNSNLDDLLDKK